MFAPYCVTFDSGHNCPRCGLPIPTTDARAHICIHKAQKREPPKLEVLEGSEICGEVDNSIRGVDGVFRPVFVQQDDGQCLALTVEDAKRLIDYLDDAIDYIQAKNWMNN